MPWDARGEWTAAAQGPLRASGRPRLRMARRGRPKLQTRLKPDQFLSQVANRAAFDWPEDCPFVRGQILAKALDKSRKRRLPGGASGLQFSHWFQVIVCCCCSSSAGKQNAQARFLAARDRPLAISDHSLTRNWHDNRCQPFDPAARCSISGGVILLQRSAITGG